MHPAIIHEPFMMLVRKWSPNTIGLVSGKFVLAEERACIAAQTFHAFLSATLPEILLTRYWLLRLHKEARVQGRVGFLMFVFCQNPSKKETFG